MNLTYYQQSIRPLFECLRGCSVLEIGPFQGQHTQLLVEGGVKTATLVEPNAEAAAYLQQHYNFDVVVADAYRYLNTPKYHDAVLLCGVLYHLHSPLYLLELIANNVNPQYIITETHLSGHELIGNYGYEQLNVPGNRYTGGWRGVGFNCSMSERVMGESMSNLGYKCETSLTHPPMANSDGFYNTKAHSTMAVWRRM